MREDVYKQVRAVYDNKDEMDQLDSEDRRLVEKMELTYRRAVGKALFTREELDGMPDNFFDNRKTEEVDEMLVLKLKNILHMREDVYKQVRAVYDNKDEMDKLDAEDRRLVEKMELTYRRAGMLLPKEKLGKALFTREELDGMPDNFFEDRKTEEVDVYFAHFHEDFRLAELDALSQLEGVEVEYDRSSYTASSPFLVVTIASSAAAARLVRRGILIRSIAEYWGSGATYAQVYDEVKQDSERWDAYKQCSFKFTVEGFGRSLSQAEKVRVIEGFSFMGFEGPIRMKGAEAEFLVCEEYGEAQAAVPVAEVKRIWFGRVVGTGSRELIDRFDVKKRRYLGNTTMDAELSLLMANQALARDGMLVYDPFVGTGSFLLTCAHFGACTMGSDIDGRQIRGTAGFKRGVDGIHANLQQYGVGERVLDTVVFDVCRNPWRAGALFDAIVTDPPYGVRAGAKRLGRKDGTNAERSLRVVDGVTNCKRDDYYPPTMPYEMSDVVRDLLQLAAEKLVVGGRLVYWLPTVAGEYVPTDVPQHPALRLVANSEQPFGGWSRRLITMEKIKPLDQSHSVSAVEHDPAHKNFRDRYFSKFERL
ncbi:hypothetical protein IWW50_000037 [Coemansia erecta]|nr:hypothetical protein IWW50_000037 [Coemansia erecta]